MQVMKEKEPQQQPWISLKEAAPMFGMSFESVKNLVLADKFFVPTYRLGRQRVIDREVLTAFFEAQKAEGMRRLQSRPANTKPR
jgi:hypothetical protein